MLRPFFYAWMFFILLATVSSGQVSVAQAEQFGSFLWTDVSGESDPTKPLTVYYRSPTNFSADTPVWFVMHGASRNADDYRDYLAAAPGATDALIIAPQFDKTNWPGSRSCNLGNVAVSESNHTPRDRTDWSFSKIEPLFDYVTTTFAPQVTADSYSMYGHSAGAQFIHRYLMWEPDARVKLAVAANAGWYTLPLYAEPGDPYPYAWPYSLSGAPDYDASTAPLDPIPAANPTAAFAKRLVVLLGDQDTQRTSSVRQTTEADAQGLNRFERGQFFFTTAEDEAEEQAVPFHWRQQIVPGVGHSGSQMAVPAAELLRSADATVGDFNADGVIDGADYTLWAASFGTSFVPGLFGDGNADGTVNAADYTVWRDQLVPTTSVIPEPSGVMLLVVTAITAIGLRSVPRG